MKFEMPLAQLQALNRRRFLGECAAGLGGIFLGALPGRSFGAPHLDFKRNPAAPLASLPPQFAPRTRRIIYLHMNGAPSQLELFDHKPELTRFDGKDCPASLLKGKRFAFISGVPKLMGSVYPFSQVGQSGAWLSDRMPFLKAHVDDLCFIKSMRTDQFNHSPAELTLLTGTSRLGNPSLGSWVTYGLGTENQNLPGFIVLMSGKPPSGGKQLWGAGFLPSVYQGVQCRSNGDPVLFLENPRDVSRTQRRHMLDAIDRINQRTFEDFGSPETITRIAQYEMAFRMQLEATDAMDIRRESKATLAAYGAKIGEATFANNCLVARRLAERGVRYIQLHHGDWDTHGTSREQALNYGFNDRCKETDQPVAALLSDLKSRGMLDDTLVVWAGEFGRTSMRQNTDAGNPKFKGRDHNPGAFTIWMAGGGVKKGFSHGETDDLGYEVAKDPVELRDLHATILYLLGFDHHKLNYPYQGLEQKLTGVKPAQVIAQILA